MQKPNWSVVGVKPQKDFKLLVRFVDGEEKVYDVKPLFRYPIYAPLKNPDFFRKAQVRYGTVVWDEDIDIAPENLYEDGIPA